MKAEHRKGDSYTDRLFQWLKYEKNLPIELVNIIKPKVYHVTYNRKPMILKGYRRSYVLQQQIDFFSNFPKATRIGAVPLPFKDGIPTLSKLGCEWGLFSWMTGRHADFADAKDRQAAVKVLEQFHRTAMDVDMFSIPKDPLYVKWEKRLDRFEDTKDVFQEYRSKRLYDELHTCMSQQLEKFRQYNWGEIEEKAWVNHEWLHGDVAHHNFMINHEGEAKLIDFDLLHTGPHLYDHIQLGQRFLPYLEKNRSALFHHFSHVKEKEIWLQGVRVPADLLREWLYGYRRCRYEEDRYSRQINKLNRAWESRKVFVRYTEHML
ncbi:aminoglycoside phosphotransferase family protein [Halobacillus fulvus]|nr:aminoglycoside phosphotransferase family protein [Halobacillus fulvus]